VLLWYEWKICNNESSPVMLQRGEGKSKFIKYGSALEQKPKGNIPAGECSEASEVVEVDTCSFEGGKIGKITMPKSIILQSTAVLTKVLISCASQLSNLR